MKIDFEVQISPDNYRDFRFLFFLSVTACMISCSPSKTDNHKFTNYYRQGEQLYSKHCSNCHQANGTGLGRVYPPLHQSDFMDNNFEQVICLMKYGIEGELVVNGIQFNQAMPGIPSLTDLEVAQLATYIYNTWSRERGIVEVKEASRVLNTCR
jgi:cytochrome c551